MTPMAKSQLAWLAGGVAGAAIFKEHRVLGGVLGALVVGAVADKMIEKYDPKYTGGRTRGAISDRIAKLHARAGKALVGAR